MNQIPLNQATLAGVLVFQNRADYLQRMGHQPPQYTDQLPIQCWMYVGPDNSTQGGANPYRGAFYNLVFHEIVRNEAGQLIYGVPVLEQTFISQRTATRVNLPGDQAGIPVDTQQFPIRDLLPGESIQAGFGGVPIIVQS